MGVCGCASRQAGVSREGGGSVERRGHASVGNRWEVHWFRIKRRSSRGGGPTHRLGQGELRGDDVGVDVPGKELLGVGNLGLRLGQDAGVDLSCSSREGMQVGRWAGGRAVGRRMNEVSGRRAGDAEQCCSGVGSRNVHSCTPPRRAPPRLLSPHPTLTPTEETVRTVSNSPAVVSITGTSFSAGRQADGAGRGQAEGAKRAGKVRHRGGLQPTSRRGFSSASPPPYPPEYFMRMRSVAALHNETVGSERACTLDATGAGATTPLASNPGAPYTAPPRAADRLTSWLTPRCGASR